MITTYDIMIFTALEKDILKLVSILFQILFASLFVGYKLATENFSPDQIYYIELLTYLLELTVGYIVCHIIDLTPVLNTPPWI